MKTPLGIIMVLSASVAWAADSGSQPYKVSNGVRYFNSMMLFQRYCLLALLLILSCSGLVNAGPLNVDSVTIIPGSGNNATLDLRSSGHPGDPGLTFTFLESGSAAVFKIHRTGGLWQWQSMTGEGDDRLLMQLGPSSSNGYSSFTLFDPGNDDGTPAIEINAGSSQDGVSPSITINGYPVLMGNLGLFGLAIDDGSDNSFVNFHAPNGDANLSLQGNGGHEWILSGGKTQDWAGGFQIYDQTANASRFAIDTFGNVSIGANAIQGTPPMYVSNSGKLFLTGYSNEPSEIISTIASTGDQIPMAFATDDGSGQLTVQGTVKGDVGGNMAVSGMGFVSFQSGGLDYAHDHMRVVQSGAVSIGDYSWSDEMEGQNAGVLAVQDKVGIGTTTPAAQLHVTGNGRFDGVVRIAQQGDLSMGEFIAEPAQGGNENMAASSGYNSALRGQSAASGVLTSGSTVTAIPGKLQLTAPHAAAVVTVPSRSQLSGTSRVVIP